MEQNLVGYLLKALDSEANREVEVYLRTQPDAQRQLEMVRRALLPLAADQNDHEPPPDLWVRTLGRIAEYKCRDTAAPPPARPRARPSPAVRPGERIHRTWWRRADVLVAAALLVAVLALVPYGIYEVRYRSGIAACANNLREFHTALVDYSDRHNGQFPQVDDRPPRNFAGVFVPTLVSENPNVARLSVNCPSGGISTQTPLTLAQLEALHREQPSEFERQVKVLGGCYAYPLGYRDEQRKLQGLRRDHSQLPLMADRPPLDQDLADPTRYSPNHAGRGQNVLFVDGHVQFFKTRAAGIDGDDIFLSHNKLIEAGRDPTDSVLGASGSRPNPPPAGD